MDVKSFNGFVEDKPCRRCGLWTDLYYCHDDEWTCIDCIKGSCQCGNNGSGDCDWCVTLEWAMGEDHELFEEKAA